jgi:hypothetical protein
MMPLFARRDGLDAHAGSRLERSAARGIGVSDAVEPDDRATGGQIGAGHELHQIVERGIRVFEQVPSRPYDLDQVVRRHIGGHADRDAARAVDEEVGVGRRQHLGLLELVVVVGHEVDNVFVEVGREGEGRGFEAGLGVAGGGGAVVERAEVAVAVDERNAQRERLRQAHEGVVDGAITVRVQLSHHLADDAGRLHVPAVGPQPHLGHLIEDAALHGFESVARIGQRARVDDRVGVFEEGPLHFGRDVDVFDALVDRGGGGVLIAAGHTCFLTWVVVRLRATGGFAPGCARLSRWLQSYRSRPFVRAA